ncbi:MAG: aminotransferase class I/II-fold pyridoxal phosphate-dependent enzyme [Clostridia bacterium]|nr:aminotransferase class I/II-fold pyridoxal phosphate-dependent enzyme [Clostridia bacterium]
MKYESLTKEELQSALAAEKKRYNAFLKEKLSLDMSRGKPAASQLDLGAPLLSVLNKDTTFPKGTDYRNYGLLDGIPEMKKLFADLFDIPDEYVFVGGNSSLNLMYDMISDAMLTGVLGSTPWVRLPQKVKFICPVPGYDRHFNICEKLGIEMISVPMNEDGPDMDIVESIAASDPYIKGIWCVPRFSNPGGIVYSEEVVRRLATMKVAAPDFRIYYDNSYFVHTLTEDAPELANIFRIAKEYDTEDRIYMFSSTSKITFAGSGVAMIAASPKNLLSIKEKMGWKTIGFNKVWQYAHYLYLQSAAHVLDIMREQAKLIRPKFEIVLDAFGEAFGDSDTVTWNTPKGGYFICLKCMRGTAKAIWTMCKKAGLTITPAGASHPLHFDDSDSYLRIAPTYPSAEDLKKATEVLVTVVKIVTMEALLAK